MRRRGPEEEACGVWLDVAALKRRKVQTHLVKPGAKLLTLFPGEREPKISFTQRTTPSAGIRQTNIASFFTLQSGKTNGGDKRNVPSLRERQNNEDAKAMHQLHHPVEGIGTPLATSTPADIHEPGLSLHSLQASGHHRTGTPFLTALPLSEPDTLVCTGKSKASLACSFTQDLESSCALDQKEGEMESSQKRKWLHRYKEKNCQGVERQIIPPRCKDYQLLDRTKVEKMSIKENRQAPVLTTHGDSWSGENTESAKQSPCPISGFTWDSENNRDCWSQLFTEDSQGQRVIAHHSRAPFQDVTNVQTQGVGQSPDNLQAQHQDMSTQLNPHSDLLFTQDSEGNQVIRHQVGMHF
ncbi:PREDICTED: aurora kinase A and ninein-interacting protein [Condylura cristata]|uniref:aurora kinase A and ninein-interacting protein n=1 Tax=Condylura cristata TaxID=143302 RepID=UPI000642EE69|nr:PREDICTED: aurora kinase A and ninein-interacting protein [Condylura cristata]